MRRAADHADDDHAVCHAFIHSMAIAIDIGESSRARAGRMLGPHKSGPSLELIASNPNARPARFRFSISIDFNRDEENKHDRKTDGDMRAEPRGRRTRALTSPSHTMRYERI